MKEKILQPIKIYSLCSISYFLVILLVISQTYCLFNENLLNDSKNTLKQLNTGETISKERKKNNKEIKNNSFNNEAIDTNISDLELEALSKDINFDDQELSKEDIDLINKNSNENKKSKNIRSNNSNDNKLKQDKGKNNIPDAEKLIRDRPYQTFISKKEVRYLLEVLKNSSVFSKLFYRAKTIVQKQTENDFDFNIMSNSDLKLNRSYPEIYRDSSNSVSIKGVLDLISLNSNYVMKTISVWGILNQHNFVLYNDRTSLTIILQIKRIHLKYEDIKTTPCILIYRSNILNDKANDSYVVCSNSISDKDEWLEMFKINYH